MRRGRASSVERETRLALDAAIGTTDTWLSLPTGRGAASTSPWTLDAGLSTSHELARRSEMAARRPRAGDRAGPRQRQGADARLDEPRSPRPHRQDGRGALLVARATPAVAQGRAIRTRPASPGNPARLRQRLHSRDRRAVGRHRVPHRTRKLLFSAARGRSLGSGRARAQGSGGDLWCRLTDRTRPPTFSTGSLLRSRPAKGPIRRRPTSPRSLRKATTRF